MSRKTWVSSQRQMLWKYSMTSSRINTKPSTTLIIRSRLRTICLRLNWREMRTIILLIRCPHWLPSPSFRQSWMTHPSLTWFKITCRRRRWPRESSSDNKRWLIILVRSPQVLRPVTFLISLWLRWHCLHFTARLLILSRSSSWQEAKRMQTNSTGLFQKYQSTWPMMCQRRSIEFWKMILTSLMVNFRCRSQPRSTPSNHMFTAVGAKLSGLMVVIAILLGTISLSTPIATSSHQADDVMRSSRVILTTKEKKYN